MCAADRGDRIGNIGSAVKMVVASFLVQVAGPYAGITVKMTGLFWLR